MTYLKRVNITRCNDGWDVDITYGPEEKAAKGDMDEGFHARTFREAMAELNKRFTENRSIECIKMESKRIS